MDGRTRENADEEILENIKKIRYESQLRTVQDSISGSKMSTSATAVENLTTKVCSKWKSAPLPFHNVYMSDLISVVENNFKCEAPKAHLKQ